MLNYITTMIDDKKDLIEKSKILKKVKKELKKEYVGIDKEIDQLISYVEPWYIFNDIQNKPTVINLFGMTGVGKTSLIQRLFYHLEIQNNLYRFDVRTLLDEDKISTKMKSLSDGKKNIGIIFDEFQNARTLDQQGYEETNSGLRGLWDLLDSGKIEMTSISYVARRVYFAYSALMSVINNGVKIKNGVFKNKIKFIKTKLSYDNFAFDDTDKHDKNHIGNYLSDTFYDIKSELPEYMGYEHICSLMDNLNTEGVVSFFEEVLEKLSKPKIHDFTKSIIFIIGNLDEVYTNHSNFNPDMDADMLNKLSKKISITNVKSALSKRFRSEQIARLGNNHLIYPTLDVKSFEEIIRIELDNINNDIYKKYNVKFNFKKSINNILYKECVFPTQGARPVFSRVNSIIRPIISKIMKIIYNEEIGFDFKKISWSYIDKKHKITFKGNEKDKHYYFEFPLQIEDLRESTGDDSQYKVAVHEAGHAVASIINMKLLPKSIYSKTADTNSKGFCSFDLPEEKTREFYNDYIKVNLGGYVAEKMVFGEDQLSDGCYGDFQTSTSLANKMVKLFGMYGDPMLIVTHNSPDDNYVSIKERGFDKRVRTIIMDNLKEVEKTLLENKELFFEISNYLTENSFIDQKKLKKLVKNIDPNIIKSLKDKDNYFEFKKKYKKFFKINNKLCI